jgi:hypothetical protein
VKVAVTGIDTLDDLARSLTGGDAGPDTALRAFMALYSEALQRAMPMRSGTLRSSMRVQMNAGEALIQVTAPYALYVLLGVQAQWMRWLEGKTISFIASDGERVTRRLVRVGVWGGKSHWWRPATPPNDFFQTALDDPRIVRALTDLAEQGMPVQVAYSLPAAR